MRWVGRILALGLGLAFGLGPAHSAPADPVDVAPSTRSDKSVRTEMKKILSGRDYRQLRREALRAKEKKKPPPPKKSCQNDDRQGCQGCRDCGQGCQGSGCGGGGAGVGALGSGLLYVIVLAAVVFLLALIAWTIARHWKKKSEEEDLEDLLDAEAIAPSTPPGEHPSNVYLQRALAAAEAGDHRGAIRQLLLGCMSWIERNGLIRFRRGLTNRDYLRAVYRREQHREGMSGIITEFERIYFGRRDATAEKFQRCLDGFQGRFEKDEGEAEMAH